MNKIFVLLILSMFLISFVSALDFELNPFATKKIVDTEIKVDTPTFLSADYNVKYPILKFSKTLFWIETDKIAEYSLISNTEQCLINCEAKGKVVLYQEGKMFDNLRFLNKGGVEIDLPTAKYYLKEIEYYDFEVIDQTKEVCAIPKINETNTKEILKEVCTTEVLSYKNETRTKEVWNEYKGQQLIAGNYEWKIKATKQKNQELDFIPIAQEKDLSEWAWWNNNWAYKKSINITATSTTINNFTKYLEIIYNESMQSDFDDLRFTDNTDNTELYFDWDFKNSTTTGVWVRMTNLITGVNTINMYYGNTLATEGNNSEETYKGIRNVLHYNYNVDNLGDFDTFIIEDAIEYLNNSLFKTGFKNESTPYQGIYSNTNLELINKNWLINTIINTESETTGGAVLGFGLEANPSGWGSGGCYVRTGLCGAGLRVCCGDQTSGAWSGWTSCGELNSNTDYIISYKHNATKSYCYLNGVQKNTFGGNSGSYLEPLKFGYREVVGASHNFGGLNLDGTYYYDVEENLITDNFISNLGQNLNVSSYIFGEEQLIPTAKIYLTLISPANNTLTSNPLVNMIVNVTPVSVNLTNITFKTREKYFGGSQTYFESLSGNESIIKNWSSTFTEDTFFWNVTVCYFGTDLIHNCTTSETRTFKVDSTLPTITINSNPVIYNQLVNHTINFTATDSNLNSCWYAYPNNATNISVSCSSGVLTNFSHEILSGFNNGTIWANDTAGNLNNVSFLLTLDSSSPNITILSGNGTYTYGILTTNKTINYTIYDNNLASCWMEYNLSNISIPCINGTNSSISFGLVYKNYSATIWANDTIGNLKGYIVNWSFILFENSISAATASQEMSFEPFILNTTIKNGYTVNIATFIYNNTDYTGVVSVSGDNKIITNNIEIPPLNGAANFQFYWKLTISDTETNTYEIYTTYNNQSVTLISLILCNGTTITTLNFTTKDEEDYTLLNNTFNVNLNYYPTTGSGSLVKTFNYQNLTEDTPYRSLCIYPDSTMLKLDGVISYKSIGYDTRTYYFSDFDTTNITQNISLYLALIDNSDIVQFAVVDDFDNSVQDAIIFIEKWDVGLGEFFTVNTVTSDSDGKAASNLILYETYYRFKIYYNDILYLVDGPSILSTTTKNFKIYFTEQPDYSIFDNINHSLSFNSTTNVTEFIWNGNGITEGCMVIKNNTNGLYNNIIYDDCFSSTSGIINVLVNTPGTYNAYGIITMEDAEGNSISKIVDSLIFSNNRLAKYVTVGNFGRAASFILIGTSASIGVAAGSIPLGLGLIIMSIFAIDWIGFLDMRAFIWSIISLVIIILVVSARRRK